MSNPLSFKSEGIELRPREQTIANTVKQSKDIPLDTSISSSIFLYEDGKLYFRDNINQDPIPLSKVKNFYNRLRFEDGELRFYDEDIKTFVSLSDIIATKDVTLKPNSLIYSSSKRLDNPVEYDAISHIENVIEEFGEVKGGILDDFFEDGKKLLKSIMIEDDYIINANEETVLDTLIDNFLTGIQVTATTVQRENIYPDAPVPPTTVILEEYPVGSTEAEQEAIDIRNDNLLTEYEDAEDLYEDLLDAYEEEVELLDEAEPILDTIYSFETASEDLTLNNAYTILPNLKVFLRDSHISFTRASDDFVGKIELQGSPFSVFENYVTERMERFNGIGKFIVGLFGEKSGEYADLVFNDPLSILDKDEGFITLNSVRNSACGGTDSTLKPFAFSSSYPKFVGNFPERGKLTLEYVSGSMQLRGEPTSLNAKILAVNVNECTDSEGYIGSVKSNATYTYADIDLTDEKYTQVSDEEALTGPFYSNPYGTDPEDWPYEHDLDPFQTGPSITELTPLIRKENCFFDFNFGGPSQRCPIYETFPSCKGEWCNNTKYPPLPPEITGFPTEFDGELWLWYNTNDNKGNIGDITYSYKWEPLDGNIAPKRSKIRGKGVFNDISQLEEFQPLILSDIAKGITNVLIRAVIDEYKFIFTRDNILYSTEGVEYFRGEGEVLGIVDFDDYFQEVLNRIKNRKKDDIITSITNVVDWSFGKRKTITEKLSIGGHIDNLIKINYKKLFGVWFDVPDFYTVIPPVDNDTGVTITSTFSPFFTTKNDTRFEFRLYDSTTDTQLDSIHVDSKQSRENEMTNVGDLNKGFVSSFPLELCYFGPLSNISCDKKIYDAKINECSIKDVKTHIKLNIAECTSNDVIDSESGFKVIADRYLKNSSVLKQNEVNIRSPRIIKVQWRILGSEDSLKDLPTLMERGVPNFLQKYIHRDNVSNMLFNFDGSDSSTMRINANVYSTGGHTNTNTLLKHGRINFNNVERGEIIFNFNSKYEGEPDYSIDLTCSKNIKVWWDNKTLKGFSVIAEKPFTGTIDWVISQEQSGEKGKLESFDKEMPTCLIENDQEFNKTNFDIFVDEGYNI